MKSKFPEDLPIGDPSVADPGDQKCFFAKVVATPAPGAPEAVYAEDWGQPSSLRDYKAMCSDARRRAGDGKTIQLHSDVVESRGWFAYQEPEQSPGGTVVIICSDTFNISAGFIGIKGATIQDALDFALTQIQH
ncbi:hypothetical protein ACFVVC_01655 [Pseudarthrobacter sp. NPDC058196]|uniref:hypothetical protein n=1 Tax=Pseudarthrobacter sp. NPDC058196 TaxID=3346376 RepID=UPI0036DE4F72